MMYKDKYRTNMRGEVWLADFGKGQGSEQEGVRPCVVLQNNLLTETSHTLIVLPATKAKKKMVSTQVTLNLKELSQGLCEQTRVVDKSRLLRYMGKLSPDEMLKINKKLAFTLGLYI